MHSPLADYNVETVRSERECREENIVTKRTPRLTDRKISLLIQNKTSYRHSSINRRRSPKHDFILRSFAYGGLSEVNKLWVLIWYALYRFYKIYTELLCRGSLDPDGRRVRKLMMLPMKLFSGFIIKDAVYIYWAEITSYIIFSYSVFYIIDIFA